MTFTTPTWFELGERARNVLTANQSLRSWVAVLFLVFGLAACSPTSAPDRSIELSSARVSDGQLATATNALTRDAEEAALAGTFLGQIINPPVLVQDFVAPSTVDGVTSLNDLAGTWRMIFFGYMHCPDFCPLTLVDYKQTKALLGEDAAAVTFVFISVDAVRDPPDKMRAYLANFDPDFVGYSVPDVTLSRIQPDYGFYYERQLGSGEGAVYTIDHSTRSYLLDPDGRLRASFAYDTPPEALAEALRWYVTHK